MNTNNNNNTNSNRKNHINNKLYLTVLFLLFFSLSVWSVGGTPWEPGEVLYVGGDTTKKVRMYNATTLQYMNVESPSYGGYIQALFEKNGVIYVGGAVTQKVRMYNATTLDYIRESPSYGGGIITMFEKDGVIYVGGTVTQKVRMYNATTLDYIRESPSYGGNIYTMLEKDGVIYVGGKTTFKVRMYNATTLDYIRESPSYGGNIWHILEKDGVIYVGGTDTQKVRMYNATTLQYMNVESPSYGGDIYTMLEKDGVIYVGGRTTFKVRMYNATTLQYMNVESPSYGGDIRMIKYYNGYIYAGGDSIYKIYIYNATNLNYLKQSISYGGHIYNILLNGMEKQPSPPTPPINIMIESPEDGKAYPFYEPLPLSISLDYNETETSISEVWYNWNGTDVQVPLAHVKKPSTIQYCYQESATVPNQSGTDTCDFLDYGGNYYSLPSDARDGNWNTYDFLTNGNNYIKYNTPALQDNQHILSATLKIKAGYKNLMGEERGSTLREYEIPQTCIHDELSLNINNDGTNSDIYCYTKNNTSVSVGSFGSIFIKYDALYEEAITWEIETTEEYEGPINITLPMGHHTLNVYAKDTEDNVFSTSIAFTMYGIPTCGTFNYLPNVLRNDKNMLLTWQHGSCMFPIHYNLYIYDNNNNLIRTEAISNSTTSFNINSPNGIYYPIIETCNPYACSNQTGPKYAFQSIGLSTPNINITSLENYKVVMSCSNVNDLLNKNKLPIIYKNDVPYNSTYNNPNYIKDFTTNLTEDATHNFKGTCFYTLEDNHYNITSENFPIKITPLSINTCEDANGFLDFIIASENNTAKQGDLSANNKVQQPLGDINYSFSFSEKNHQKLCITPKKEYRISSNIYYKADNVGKTEEYYLKDAKYDFSKDNELYLYSTFYTNLLTVSVYDEYNNKMPNIIVQLVKYFPDSDSSKTIMSSKTNEEGIVNFFYNMDDLIKLIAYKEDEKIHEDEEFAKYFSAGGSYSRVIKLKSQSKPVVEQLDYRCYIMEPILGEKSIVTCDFKCFDGKQRDFKLTIYESELGKNKTSKSIDIYACSGQLILETEAMSGFYEFKIDNVTRQTGVTKFNPDAIPIELKFYVYPLILVSLVLGTINPMFAIAGLLITGLFVPTAENSMLLFDSSFIMVSIVIILISFVLENFMKK